jgi:SAM-dependent methyltransferase
MELEYKGNERNRKTNDSDFLLTANAAVQNLVHRSENNQDINILDIGCGTEACFLDDISNNSEISDICNRKNIDLNLFGISADSETKPDNILHYKQFLSATKGLECLPNNVHFDYIVSSWCINYLGPNTFRRLLNDCLDRLKTGGIIEMTPFNPSSFSCAFPKALEFIEINRKFLPLLLCKNRESQANIKKAKSLIRTYMKMLDLNLTPQQIKDYNSLLLMEDPLMIYKLFQRNFYSSIEKVAAKCEAISLDYGIKRFFEKEEILKDALDDNDKYRYFIYQIGNLDVLSIRREH